MVWMTSQHQSKPHVCAAARVSDRSASLAPLAEQKQQVCYAYAITMKFLQILPVEFVLDTVIRYAVQHALQKGKKKL